MTSQLENNPQPNSFGSLVTFAIKNPRQASLNGIHLLLALMIRQLTFRRFKNGIK